jgi:hypothetical protein
MLSAKHQTMDLCNFFDSYSTGYTSLFNTIGFVVETHMLKKYADRVKATYDYMAPQLILWIPITKNQTNAAKTKNSMRLKTPTLTN